MRALSAILHMRHYLAHHRGQGFAIQRLTFRPAIVAVIAQHAVDHLFSKPHGEFEVEVGEGIKAARVDAAITVPLAAVAADAQGQPGVWVVNEDGRVARRPIRTGAIVGADIAVVSGLAPGERIVAAGVGALREGMPVRPLEPR